VFHPKDYPRGNALDALPKSRCPPVVQFCEVGKKTGVAMEHNTTVWHLLCTKKNLWHFFHNMDGTY